MSIYLGEIAAILTALCWTFTATFFSMAGKEVGSVVVNRIRLVLAVLFLTLTHWLMFGRPFPVEVAGERFWWLAFSGVVGLVIADAFLFQSYVWIGARLGMLLLSGSPVVATLLAWIFLGEKLHGLQITGVLVTVAGIAWVVLDRSGQNSLNSRTPNYLWGILFGIGAATGQAIGLIAAKKGMGADFPALSANLIRMVAAAAVMWGITLAQRQAGSTIRRFLAHRHAMRNILAGTFFGPFVGVWLSLVAVQLTHIGVASTLMALAPIFMLPVGRFVFKEQVGWTAVLGTLVAVAGVSLLFWG
jgi:drug/metabolite transporter (DMT)-like permease